MKEHAIMAGDLIQVLKDLGIKHVRVRGAGLKCKDFEHLLKFAAPGMGHSLDLAL